MKVLSVIFCAILWLSPVFADSITFTASTTIGCGNTTYEGYDVTVNGCAVTVGCLHSFRSLRIINGGLVTHAAGDSAGVYLSITHNMLVDATGQINAVGRGYGPRTGPGAGHASGAYGSGGGHAGTGGTSTMVDTGGVAYGSVGTPLQMGSGGGANGGFGGGVIRLIVGDTLTVAGALWANGGNCSNTAGAGGGGSIYATAGCLAGAGQISATGGVAQSSGGGGGGGRIALYYSARTFTGTISACGGSGYQYGGGGTIFTRNFTQPLGDLLLFNCTLLNTGVTPLGDLPPCNVLINSHGSVVLRDSAMTVDGYFRVAATGQVWAQAGQRAQLTVHGTMTIDSNATFSAAGCGYGTGSGPGAGSTVSGYGGGGGYGGAGGAGGSAGTATGGVTYPTITAPQEFGSGGGGTYGGAGGGALHIVVDDTLRVNGVLSANGAIGTNLSGAGAGGSLYLEVGTLTGLGSVTAQGGQGGANGGGGGGGCLAFYYTSNLFTGTLSACGGWGLRYGGAGMLYTKAASQSVGELAISNCTHNGAVSGLINPPHCNITVTSGGIADCADTAWSITGNVRVTGTGQLWIAAGHPVQFTVNGQLRIDSLGIFSALGRGYAAGTGPGAGATLGAFGGGGGHGGIGGTGTGGAVGGGTNDSQPLPVLMGSGGGGTNGARGGGALLLTVTDTLFLNDSLTVLGGESGANGGGGAGGSLWVRAPAIVGNGYITASGGNGNVGGGGGGGGRIALYTCSRTLPVTHITANGGNSQHVGSPGTVFLGTNDCNNNGHPDGCDILNGTSTDCNSNGIPDECENITSPVVVVYFTESQLLLRWNCVPGFPTYKVFGRQGNNAEVELATVEGLTYDASSLLSAPAPHRWTFRVVGWTP
ncbi:MAG TPA: hypothetical protein VGL38_15835 [bacterium]|jgi:hypothetical protein